MTPSECHICRQPCTVGIVESVWFGRWFQHRECPSCFLKRKQKEERDA